MPETFADRMARENAQLKRQSRSATAAPRLQNASLDDTDLPSFDREGNLKATFGKQPDGSHGGLVRESDPQPTPTAPDLTAKDLGALAVVWDGKTTDFAPALVHGHTEILFARSEDGSEPDISEYQKAPSTIRDRDGGGTTVVCSPPGTWFVRLRLVGQDRVTRGEPSEASSVEIEAKVNRQDMVDTLAEAQRRINVAREQLAESMGELDTKLLARINEKLTHSHDSPPEEFEGSAGDIWRVVDDAGTVQSEHEWTGTAWEPRTVSSEVIQNLDVGKLTAGSGELAEAVIDILWVKVARAKLLEADEAILGGALLKDNTIDVGKLHVTEAMVAEFAQILHLVADRVEMNRFIAQSGMVGLLEAIGLTLSDEAGGRRTEVSGAGIRVVDATTGVPEIQLGTFSDDLLTLTNRETGEVSLSASNDGSLSATRVSSELDMNVGGKPLVGETMRSPEWAAASSVLDAVSKGAPRIGPRTFSGTSGPSPRGIWQLEAPVTPGRSYRVSVPDFQMGDGANYYMTAYYTTSSDPKVRPAVPTSNSATLGTSTGRVPPAGLGWPTTTLSYEKVYSSPTTQRIRILFVVGRYGGGAVTFGTANSIATNPRFLIEDLGVRIGDGGVPTWRDPSSTTDFPVSADLVTQPYGVWQTATYTLNPTTGVATRQGINVEPRFGYWPNGLYYVTLVQFIPWNQGGVVHSLDINATVARWATTSGQVLQSGLVDMTGAPPASFAFSAARTELENLTGVGAGSQRRLPLLPEHAVAQGGQLRGSVLFGSTGWTGASQNNSAAGVIHRDKTFARLHTTTATED